MTATGNAEPGCHILSADHVWREGAPMTEARTQHTLTVVGDKIGEINRAQHTLTVVGDKIGEIDRTQHTLTVVGDKIGEIDTAHTHCSGR
jgi:hypothetical protein